MTPWPKTRPCGTGCDGPAVADPLRYYFDHNMWDAVADGLRRRGLDVVLAREAGLDAADDPAQLAYATADGRVTVTFDTDFQGLHRQGVPHAGIAWTRHDKYSIGELVELLEILARTSTADDMRNCLEHL